MATKRPALGILATLLLAAPAACMDPWPVEAPGGEAAAITSATPQRGGLYSLQQVAGGRCVRFAGDSAADVTDALASPCDGTDAQRFRLVAAATSGAYALENVQTGKCLEVAAASTAAGARVQEYACWGGANQRWTLEAQAGARYVLRNVHSGLVLDSGPTSLVQRPADGSTRQRWIFTADALSDGDLTVSPRRVLNPAPAAAYGVNWLAAAAPDQRGWKAVDRFGGNPITTFNPAQDAYNTGDDWFFLDQPMTWGGFASWKTFVDLGATRGVPMVLGIPVNARVAIGADKACMFPFTLDDAQQAYEGGCASGALCCGNGHTRASPNGYVAAPGAARLATTYTGWTPADAVRFLGQVRSRIGAAAFAQVIVELDNEPDYWNTTHHDMHPAATSADELWSRTVAFASALKAAFPGIAIAGPALAYYDHPMIDGYLQHVAAYRSAHGVQLVDYLDVHFYPSYGTFSFGDDADVPAATRIQAARLFYDPTYTNPYDGIAGAVRLIPRLKQKIAAANAGMELLITEYNLGDDHSIAGAIAQAEAIAVFGRYGLAGAMRWRAPAPGTPAESAFRLYIDHAVEGSAVEVKARPALTPATVTGYAIVRDGRLYIILVNKLTSAKTITVQTGSSRITAISGAWSFGRAHPEIAPVTLGAPVNGLLTITLPAYSATLLQASLAF